MRYRILIEANVSAEQRALDRAWSYQASKHYLVQCSAMRSADEVTLVERTEKLGRAFAKAELELGDGPYFKGESVSNVDIAWLPLLHRAAIIEDHTCYDFIAQYSKVKAWQNSLLKTRLVEGSVADDFEAAFIGFCLSDSTFLGKGARNEKASGEECESSTCC